MSKNKVQLSLVSTYLRDWGINEAIREVMQNGEDSSIDGHAMTVEHKGDKLIVTNDGVVLDTSVLLIGNTSKIGRSDQAGQFGEGLKLAMLVCAREGIAMTIRNGSEVWIPKMEESDDFAGQQVLTIHIRRGNAPVKRFAVEIEFPKEVWDSQKWKYLFVEKPNIGEVFNTQHGRLLKGERYRGCVFSRGIYVAKNNDMRYGYDLPNIKLDRDRKTLDMWDVRYEVRQVMAQVLSDERALRRKDLFDMVNGGASEVNFGDYDDVPAAIASPLSSEFKERYGESAIPVRSTAEAAELEHLGVTGVIVSSALNNALKREFGSIDDIKKKLAKDVIGNPLWSELSSTEKAHLTSAIETLTLADPDLPLSLDNVDVVNFRDKTLMGLFKDEKALIGRHVLADGVETLATLIHEIAHRKGPDGDKRHVQEIERLWTLVYKMAVSILVDDVTRRSTTCHCMTRCPKE